MKVQKWVKNSKLYESKEYRNLLEDEIPMCKLKFENLEDFDKVLEVIEFWEVEGPYPYLLWKYLFEEDRNILENHLKNIDTETSEYLLKFLTAKNRTQLSFNNYEVECFRYLRENNMLDQKVFPYIYIYLYVKIRMTCNF